jgi:hypothetical protein
MPLVGPSPAAGGIEFEDRSGTPGCADRRMRNQLAKPDREALLLGVIEMSLVAEEDDLVLEQNRVDRADRLLRQSPESLTFLISAPMRAARLIKSARGMTLSIVVVLVMIVPRSRSLPDKLRRSPIAEVNQNDVVISRLCGSMPDGGAMPSRGTFCCRCSDATSMV